MECGKPQTLIFPGNGRDCNRNPDRAEENATNIARNEARKEVIEMISRVRCPAECQILNVRLTYGKVDSRQTRAPLFSWDKYCFECDTTARVRFGCVGRSVVPSPPVRERAPELPAGPNKLNHCEAQIEETGTATATTTAADKQVAEDGAKSTAQAQAIKEASQALGRVLCPAGCPGIKSQISLQDTTVTSKPSTSTGGTVYVARAQVQWRVVAICV